MTSRHAPLGDTYLPSAVRLGTLPIVAESVADRADASFADSRDPSAHVAGDTALASTTLRAGARGKWRPVGAQARLAVAGAAVARGLPIGDVRNPQNRRAPNAERDGATECQREQPQVVASH